MRKGADPINRDDDVAFRTTYYFRTFDFCANERDKQGELPVLPLNDALYRFEMTGKASTLLTSIKFESGVLKAWEIDPFGAKIVADEETGELRFQSQDETARRANAAAAYADYQRFRDLYYGTGPNGEPLADWERQKLQSVMESRIDAYVGERVGDNLPPAAPVEITSTSVTTKPDGTVDIAVTIQSTIPDATLSLTLAYDKDGELTSASPVSQDGVTIANLRSTKGVTRRQTTFTVLVADNRTVSETPIVISHAPGDTQAQVQNGGSVIRYTLPDDAAPRVAEGQRLAPGSFNRGDGGEIICPAGATYRRGYQILGPQGQTTYNQDDRLIMAMSSSARPLIETMKSLSGRVLNTRGNETANRLVLAEERSRATKAQLAIFSASGQPAEICKAVVEALIADESLADAEIEAAKTECGSVMSENASGEQGPRQ